MRRSLREYSACTVRSRSLSCDSSFTTTRPAGVTARKTRFPSWTRSFAKGSLATTTFGTPSARARSCTCESTLPSPWVRMPAAGFSSVGVLSIATTSLRV